MYNAIMWSMKLDIRHAKSLNLESAYRKKRESRNGIRQCRANSIRGSLTIKTHPHAYGRPIRIWIEYKRKLQYIPYGNSSRRKRSIWSWRRHNIPPAWFPSSSRWQDFSSGHTCEIEKKATLNVTYWKMT